MPVDTSLYDILGVSPTATDAEIRKAFLKLSMEFHPDKHPGHEEKYKQITAAWDILKDKDKRKKYDVFGLNGMKQEPNFSNIFQHFTFNVPKASSTRGSDVNVKLQLTLEEIYTGCCKNISSTREEKCDKCDGTGGETETCSECGGKGMTARVIRQGPATIQTVTQCPLCLGMGSIIKNKCNKCKGKRTIAKAFNIEVTIDPGATDKIMVKGEGNWGKDGNGNLYINIIPKKHDRFLLNKNDIIYVREISLPEAICGFSFKIKYLDGVRTTIRVNGPIKPSDVYYYIPGKGINGGNFIVKLELKLPEISLEDLAKVMNISDSAKERIKDTSGEVLEVYKPKTDDQQKVQCNVQ